MLGIRGVVRDETGHPLNAIITIEGNSKRVFTDPENGDYYRLLSEGTYQVTTKSSGYRSVTKTVNIPSDQPPYQPIQLDFQLAPAHH